MLKQRMAGDDAPDGVQASELDMPKPSSLQVPDVHEAMRLAGVKDLVLPNDRRGAEKRQRVLCFCGVPGCGIGPMTRVEEF